MILQNQDTKHPNSNIKNLLSIFHLLHRYMNQFNLINSLHLIFQDRTTSSMKEKFRKTNYKTKNTKDFSQIAVITIKLEASENSKSFQNKTETTVHDRSRITDHQFLLIEKYQSMQQNLIQPTILL